MEKNYRSLWNGTFVRFIELLLDVILVIISLFIVLQLRWYLEYNYFLGINEVIEYYSKDFPFIVSYMFLAGIFFLVYKTSVIRKTLPSILLGIFLSLFFSNIILMLFSFILGSDFMFSPPYIAFIVLALQLVIYVPYKWVISKIFRKFNNQTILIYGTKEGVDTLFKEFLMTKEKNVSVKYLFYHSIDVGMDPEIYRYIDSVDEVYITDDVDSDTKNRILNYATFEQSKDIYIIPKTYEVLMMGAQYDQVDDTLVLHAKTMHLSLEQRFFKRAFDLIFSGLVLIVASIPMLLVALIVKMQDGGPVFYKQKRFKRDNQPFYILKFRSMKFKQTKEEEQILATSKDPRITKFGKFIRATRLDELPQLINVFVGDMSLVGPRPFMESVVAKGMEENEHFRYRSNVKPGVTGLAQVYGRYDTSTKERLRYDLMYVRKYNFFLDIKIILLTIRTMLTKEAGLGRDENKSIEQQLTMAGKKIKLIECYNYEAYEVENIAQSKNTK